MTSTFLAAYQYLGPKFKELLEDYDKAITVVYGSAAKDNLARQVVIADISWDNYETSSWGPRVNMDEDYSIECGILTAQKDGREANVIASAQDIYTILDAEIRDNPTLGNIVDFVQCAPVSCEAWMTDQGAVCVLRFRVKCRKKLS